MGNEQPSNGNSDGQSSLGNYDNQNNFGDAFNKAHSQGGPGHTFTYHGQMYTTDCKDNGNYRTTTDNRDSSNHMVHQYGHQINGIIKETTGIHIQDHLLQRGYEWSSNVDKQRVEYHRREAEKQQK